MTISRTGWSTILVDSCKPLGVLYANNFASGGATAAYTNNNLVLSVPAGGSIGFAMEVAAGVDNTFEFNIGNISGASEQGVLVTVLETIDNVQYVIGGGRLLPGRQKVNFRSVANSVSLVFPEHFTEMELAMICTKYPKSVQHTYLVDVCDESKDRYRYGFNGMEKDNELKGIGNSLDFGARMYDSRVARWLSLDPLAAKYPSISPYAFVGNSPLRFVDIDGKEIWIGYYDKTRKEIVERLRYKDGKLFNKEGIEVTTKNTYINDIKNRLDNIKELSTSVGAMVNDLEGQESIHNIYNYDTKYRSDDNVNRLISKKSKGTLTTFNSENIQSNSTTEASLSHELKHAYDRSKDQLNITEFQGKNGPFIEAEWDAINVQNQILYNQGKDLRMDYDGSKVPEDKFISPNKDDKPKKQQKSYPITTEVIMNGNTTTTTQKMSDGTSTTTTNSNTSNGK